MERAIRFKAAFGETDNEVVLTPNLARTVYDIMIDSYYMGKVVRYDVGWMVRIGAEWAGIEDQDAMLDRIGIPVEDRAYTNQITR